MTLADFFLAMNTAGVRLTRVGGRLQLRGPAGAISPEVRAGAEEHKAAILALLPDEAKAEGGAGPVPTPPHDIGGSATVPTYNASGSVVMPAHGGTRPVFIDLETRSASDLKREGGRRYARHETTEILTAVALIDGRVIAWAPTLDAPPPAGQLWPESFGPALPVEAFAGPGLPPPLADAITAGLPLCAHSAHGFDRHVWAARGLPEPSAWLDTLPEARACGLPGKLDQLGQLLFGAGKDKEGERLVRRLCHPGRRGEFPPFDLEDAVAVLRYNVADVLLLARLYEAVAGHAEPNVVALDLAINGRGVAFDCALAQALIALEVQASREAGAEAERLTGGAVKAGDLRRTAFILDWLRSRGVELPNLQKGTVRQLLLDRPDLDTGVRGVLEARLAVNRVTAGKLQSAVTTCDGDGRLRDLFVYHKAHTGRWAARRVQPHNLPRPHPDLHDLGPLRAAAGDLPGFRRAMPSSVGLADALSALIRPCFRAAQGKVLCIADFTGVEARGVAWCANETGLLRLFARGGDPYCDLAAKIFDRPVTKEMKRERGVGKEAVLGCGYGMGPDRFAETCAARGVDLAAAGITPEGVVEGYRDAYPAVAGTKVCADGFSRREGGLWNGVEDAARLAVGKGATGRAGWCEFYREGDALVVRLPSGRRLHYRNARIENRVPGYCRTPGLTPARKPTIVYNDPEKGEVVTYGGKLVENIVQAICRDLLVAALLGCEREGLPVVLHVHDEVAVEVSADRGDEALRRVVAIMSTPPAWAEGFPVEVEGFVSERYVKTPPPGAAAARARDGAVLDGQAPPLAPKPVGGAWRLDGLQAEIHVGDCRRILPTLPAESFDLAVSDPPYNIGLTYHEEYDDGQETEVFLGMLEESVREVHRVLKPSGSLFLFMGAWLQAEALVLLKKVGFHHRRTIVWHNTFGQAQQSNFTPGWTAIHYVTKRPRGFTFNADAIRVPSARQLRHNDKRANPKGKLPDDVWVLLPEIQAPGCFLPDSDVWLQSRVCGTFRERVGHVTQLPLPLVERIVKVASNPGDLVLDPFAGSGTVLVASRRLGRRGLGIELSERTAALARERLEGEARGQAPHG
jgi:DNA modification methylase